jgi:hypothetical protein
MQDPCCQMGPQMAPPPPPPPPPMQTSCTCITSEFIQIQLQNILSPFYYSYNPTKTAGHLFMCGTASASIWWWRPIPTANDGATTANGNGNGWRIRRRATANASIRWWHDGPIWRGRNGNGPTNWWRRWPTNVHLYTKFVLLAINQFIQFVL